MTKIDYKVLSNDDRIKHIHNHLKEIVKIIDASNEVEEHSSGFSAVVKIGDDTPDGVFEFLHGSKTVVDSLYGSILHPDNTDNSQIASIIREAMVNIIAEKMTNDIVDKKLADKLEDLGKQN